MKHLEPTTGRGKALLRVSLSVQRQKPYNASHYVKLAALYVIRFMFMQLCDKTTRQLLAGGELINQLEVCMSAVGSNADMQYTSKQ